MRLQQIFVAVLFISLEWPQVAAVVNNNPSSKVEESKESPSDNAEAEKPSSNDEVDSVAASTDGEANRREAPLSLGDTYGAPAVVSADSYLPSGPSSNLPVPVYGVPDAPINSIVYPEPPPDIPPPVVLPPSSYGLPVSSIYGAPPPNNYLLPSSNTYGPPNLKFEDSILSVPKYIKSGPNRNKPVYGPPRFQYGPPGKPLYNNKFSSKSPFKNFGGPKYPKPFTTYGPPGGYFKDGGYSSSKYHLNSNVGNVLSHGQLSHSGHFGQSGHSGQSAFSSQSDYSSHSGTSSFPTSGVSNQYGVPSFGIQSHLNSLDISALNGNGVTTQYGVPYFGNSIPGPQSISSQYGVPDGDILGPLKHHYGPPQPSSHPKPPHPGAPAPPTPPDIKYDGWQPIPGLVSRAPTSSFGANPNNNNIHDDVSYNNDLLPPSINTHVEHQTLHHESVGNLALDTSYGPPQQGARDSYRAPLNTVTGSGAVVSASGEEAHGNHDHHEENVNVVSSVAGLGQDIQAVKSIGYEIFTTGSGSISDGNDQSSSGHKTQLPDSYSAPPLDSYASHRPYTAGHSQSNVGGSHGSSSSFSDDTLSTHNFHNSYNSHKSHKHKGLSISTSAIGLKPPSGTYGVPSSGVYGVPSSGVYGVPPSGQYGTPLSTGSTHGFFLNALKINPPKHPVHHREPLPSGIFDSITKQATHKYRGHTSQSTYLSPPVSDIPKTASDYGLSPPSSLNSLPKIHTSVSFQNHNHGLSSSAFKYNLDTGSSSGLSSYNAPLSIVENSYNIPSDTTLSNNYDVVQLDQSHPGITIDFTQGRPSHSGSYSGSHDCSLKSQSVPSLSYGVPSANSYTASLSSLTTNIGGSYSGSSALSSTYGAPESLPIPQSQTGYDLSDPKPHEVYGVPDLSGSHSQKVSSEVKTNSIESESQGKSYGKSVAESFGASSELIQSQSIDFNNIPLQGALGSYTLQIQSADGGQNQLPHGQVLNDGLLQSILAAIEQPSKGESQPIIQFQKSLEQQNFVTNDTISSVVEQLADAEIRHSTQLAKDAIEKSSELSDSEIQHSSPTQQVIKSPSTEQKLNTSKEDKNDESNIDETTIPVVEDNGIALYFSNNQRSEKKTPVEENLEEREINSETTQNIH